MNADILTNARSTLASLKAAVEAQNWPAALMAVDSLHDIHLAAKGLTRSEWIELEQVTAQKIVLGKSIPWQAQEAWYRR
jgi:hypothetical protein